MGKKLLFSKLCHISRSSKWGPAGREGIGFLPLLRHKALNVGKKEFLRCLYENIEHLLHVLFFLYKTQENTNHKRKLIGAKIKISMLKISYFTSEISHRLEESISTYTTDNVIYRIYTQA